MKLILLDYDLSFTTRSTHPIFFAVLLLIVFLVTLVHDVWKFELCRGGEFTNKITCISLILSSEFSRPEFVIWWNILIIYDSQLCIFMEPSQMEISIILCLTWMHILRKNSIRSNLDIAHLMYDEEGKRIEGTTCIWIIFILIEEGKMTTESKVRTWDLWRVKPSL